MRLVFPGRDVADFPLHLGELSLGEGEGVDVQILGAGWESSEARLLVDARRGIWLELEPGAGTAHVNARPVRERAMLRVGDIVTLGAVQFCIVQDGDGHVPERLPRPNSGPAEGEARVAASRAVLRGVAGSFQGRSFPLTSDVVIGSGNDADIRIDLPGVEPRHCRVELHGERIFLRAEAPGSQVKVNGILMSNAVLYPDDQLALDPCRFVVEAPGLPRRGSEAPGIRQRPITQAMPAVPDEPAPAPALPGDPSAPPALGASTWLLITACLIALVLAAILLLVPF